MNQHCKLLIDMESKRLDYEPSMYLADQQFRPWTSMVDSELIRLVYRKRIDQPMNHNRR